MNQLKIEETEARRLLTALYLEGQTKVKRITNDYRTLRLSGTFAPAEHNAAWQSGFQAWHLNCINTIDRVFPTERERSRFVNAQADYHRYTMRNDEDHEWSALNCFWRTKLDFLDSVISSLGEYSPRRTAKVPNTIEPPELQHSLERFRAEHPSPNNVAFIMMQFRQTDAHGEIVSAIREACAGHGINALRADDKEYHPQLYPNVQTYMHGCASGIAVFERLESDDFNPNVSLEVGYMLALGKPVCFLKDRTLRNLQTDLLGHLYRSFDPQHPTDSIPAELEKWLADKGLK